MNCEEEEEVHLAHSADLCPFRNTNNSAATAMDQDKLWYICTICYQSFEVGARLQTHRKLVHPASDTKLVLLLTQQELTPFIRLKRCSDGVPKVKNKKIRPAFPTPHHQAVPGPPPTPPPPVKLEGRTLTATATTASAETEKGSSVQKTFRTCKPPVCIHPNQECVLLATGAGPTSATRASKSASTSTTNNPISSTNTAPSPIPTQASLELKPEILTGSGSACTPVIIGSGTIPDPSTLADGKIRCRICFHEFRTKSSLNTHFLLKHVPKDASTVNQSASSSSVVKPDPEQSSNVQQGSGSVSERAAASPSTSKEGTRRKKSHGEGEGEEERQKKAKKSKCTATTAHVQMVLGNQSESPRRISRSRKDKDEEEFLQKGKVQTSSSSSPTKNKKRKKKEHKAAKKSTRAVSPPLIWVRAVADLLEPEELDLGRAVRSVEVEHVQTNQNHGRNGSPESPTPSPDETEITVLPLPPTGSQAQAQACAAADHLSRPPQPQQGRPSKSTSGSRPSASSVPVPDLARNTATAAHQNTFTTRTPTLRQEGRRRPHEPTTGARLESRTLSKQQPEAAAATGGVEAEAEPEIIVLEEQIQPSQRNQPPAGAAAAAVLRAQDPQLLLGSASSSSGSGSRSSHNVQSASKDFLLKDILITLPTAGYFSAVQVVQEPSRICNASSERVESLAGPDTHRKRRTQDPSIDEEANKLPFPAHQLSCQYCRRVLDTLAQLDEHISQSHHDIHCDVCEEDLSLPVPGVAGGGGGGGGGATSTSAASARLDKTSKSCGTCGHVIDFLRKRQYYLIFSEERARTIYACSCGDLNLYTHAELEEEQRKKKTAAAGGGDPGNPVADTPVRTKWLKKRSCEPCKLDFSSTLNYRAHFMDVHSLRKEWICDICVRPFDSQQSMLNHQGAALGHAKYQSYLCDKCRLSKHVCEICHREFGRANALENHYKSKKVCRKERAQRAAAAAGGGGATASSPVFQPRQRAPQPQPQSSQSFRCNKCPTLPPFPSAAHLELHRLKCLSGLGPKCRYCGLEFEWIYQRSEHEKKCPKRNQPPGRQQAQAVGGGGGGGVAGRAAATATT